MTHGPAGVMISFDIDGTLEVGEPAGPIAVSVVRAALAHGYIVGSASDRTSGEQERMWARLGVEVHFIGGKHHLPRHRDEWNCDRRVHIGDTHIDAYYAGEAGFEFVDVATIELTDLIDQLVATEGSPPSSPGEGKLVQSRHRSDVFPQLHSRSDPVLRDQTVPLLH
ncbi:MAG: hypothetical protein JWN62_4564, partial [Acidimicrobiales bacterium]|nr:hypothetical protein [Acidimicrobiales bacterium]